MKNQPRWVEEEDDILSALESNSPPRTSPVIPEHKKAAEIRRSSSRRAMTTTLSTSMPLESGELPSLASLGSKSIEEVDSTVSVQSAISLSLSKRRLSRKETVAKQNAITPISIQHELMKYNTSNAHCQELWDILTRWWSIGYLKIFLLWTGWMVSGTVFYAIRNELGWGKGFYMMVNVGYSIGWGYPVEIDHKCLWFSICNILVGATALSYGLRVFAINVMSDSKSWYAVAVYKRTMQDASISRWKKLKEFCKTHKKKLLNISIFIVWVMAGVTWSTNVFAEWKFVQGLYFALSSMSTGGLYPIPRDASSNSYIIVGVFSALGIPLMGLAMSDCTRMLLKFGDPEKAKEQIQAKVTKEELDMMTKFGLDDGTGVFTKTDFIILSMMRLRMLTPSAIEEMNSRFDTLDIGKSGFLSIDKILLESRSRVMSNSMNIHTRKLRPPPVIKEDVSNQDITRNGEDPFEEIPS